MINFFRLFAICTFLFFTTNHYSQENNSSEFENLFNEAKRLSEEGEYEKALYSFEKAVEIEPENIEISKRLNLYNSLVKKYLFLGLFEEAEKRNRELFFRTQGEVVDKDQIYLDLEGSCLLAVSESLQKNYSKALDFILLFQSINKRTETYTIEKCPYRVYALAGFKDKARNILENDLKKDPQNPYYLLWQAYLEKEAGNMEKFNFLMKQLSQLKKAVDAGQIDSSWSQGKIEYLLAIYSVLQDQDKEAISHLEKAYQAGLKEYYWWRNFTPFFQELESYKEYNKLLEEMKADIDNMKENYLQSKSS